MKYLVLCTMVAMSGYVTKANASLLDSLKHKIANQVDPCNAGAGGSAKGLQVGEQCIGEPGKNPNFAKAYWKAHCNAGNPGGDGDEALCENAFAAVKAPDGVTGCNEASWQAIEAMDPADQKKASTWFKANCIDDTKQLAKAKTGDNQDPEELAAATGWGQAHCGDTIAAADKKSCTAVKKAVPDA